jgi:hypothetical protein
MIAERTSMLRYTHHQSCNFSLMVFYIYNSRSQWQCGLRLGSAVARLLTSRVRIPSGAWMSFCSGCCVLSGRGLCDEVITRPEESYRLWNVVVCDLKTSYIRRPWPSGDCCAKNKQKSFISSLSLRL